eukprot:6244368-Amphidinium_carterae.1
MCLHPKANERYFEMHAEPLFSSHMIDLSEAPSSMNQGTRDYRDGVNNEDVNPEDLYSKPEEIAQVYEELTKVEGGNAL